MSATEYIASFFLVILGFAISEMLKGSARLIRQRKEIEFYWPYLVIIPFLFEILIFWFLWVFIIITTDSDGNWTIVEIIRLSIPVIPWAFVSYLIFPSGDLKGFSIRNFYFENGRVIMLIVTLLNGYVIFDMLFTGNRQGLWIMVVNLGLNIIVMVWFEKLHLIWLFLSLILVNYFIFFAKPLSIG